MTRKPAQPTAPATTTRREGPSVALQMTASRVLKVEKSGSFVRIEAGAGNPQVADGQAAPRCSATAKRTGRPCRDSAVTGWTVCRLQGAGGGQPPGKAHPNYRLGERSREAVALRAQVRRLVRDVVTCCQS